MSGLAPDPTGGWFGSAVLGVYTFRGFDKVDEIVRIPVIEYGLVFLLTLLVWPVVALVDAIRRRRGADAGATAARETPVPARESPERLPRSG